MPDQLHIITHEIPWPVDYGGVYDLFYKIKALHQQGIRIHLHCFTRTRAAQPMLEQYCEEVHYYQRKTSVFKVLKGIPYIVADRSSAELAERLNKDNHPILLEGIHVTYCLRQLKHSDRKIMVRLHNIESVYYRALYRNEKQFLKKAYYLIESWLLRKYEVNIIKRYPTLTVSSSDLEIIKQKIPQADIRYMPVFIPWKQVKSSEGLGSYCLYHGNLSVNENEAAAIWLLENVFHSSKIPLVIAGKNPSKKLISLAHRQTNTCIVANPDQHEMEDMIRKAQINILPSFNLTGVKIKIIESLFLGRHCITNSNGSGDRLLDQCVITAGSVETIKSTIEQLYNVSFTAEEKQKRSELLSQIFNEQQSVKLILKWLS